MSKPGSTSGSGRGTSPASSPGKGGGNLGTIPQQESRFKLRNPTQDDEDNFNVILARNLPKPSGVLGSIAHLVKGALGSGILSGHVAYKTAGIWVALPLNIFLGIYMSYCLYVLVISAQVLYRRTGVPVMTYPDVGEAACKLFPNRSVKRMAKIFRYTIDIIICIDLFGACATYQIIISKTIKQLVEDRHIVGMSGAYPGYPSLRAYLAIMIVPIIIICLLRHLQWLAPFSMIANCLLMVCIGLTVYYAFDNNPTFGGMVPATTPGQAFEFIGMLTFSMSCAGVVIPIENNMLEPHKYPIVLCVGMAIVVIGVIVTSLFGYAAYLEKSDAPITINFPMKIFPKIVKGGMAAMIYVTHALNFWVPFNLVFHYLRKLHSLRNEVVWELIYRAIFVALIAVIAILFPSISALMGFLGCFCLSNMAFIWPYVIELLVIWERPGGLPSSKQKLLSFDAVQFRFLN